MSARNGDKARYGRERKRKLQLRLGFRALRKALDNPLAAPEHSKTPVAEDGAPAQEPAAAKDDSGLLGKTAQSIGSALGTVAARLKPKEHAEHE